MPFDGSTFVPDTVPALTETDKDRIKRKRAERLAKERSLMRRAAEDYIAADRTDPFARARIMTHIDNGVASPRREANQDLEVSAGRAFYCASRTMTMRKVAVRGEIVDVPTPVYTNVMRP